MIGSYAWQQAHTRHLAPVDYEEVAITSGQVGLDANKVEACEFVFLILQGDPIRALWFPTASLVLSDTSGVIFFNAQSTILNRNEARNWLATLNTGATTSAVLAHYYK